MKFWKENKIDQMFEMPAIEVAAKFAEWAASNEVGMEMLAGLPVERCLRWWLTSSEHFNSVWEAEKGHESFDTLMNAVMDLIYPPPCKACKPGSRSRRHTCGLAGLQDMMQIG